MAPSDERLPVTLLTGFLGSGKTTLLNGLLRHPELQDTAVIINEFGEIGLDHLLVTAGEENVLLLDAGCLCCTVLGTLKETLADLYHRRARAELPLFRRVLIETTGLADPAPVLQSIIRDSMISHLFRLDAVIATVDALFGMEQLEAHPEALAQAAIADRLVVTKIDRTGYALPPGLEARLRALNPVATLLPVAKGKIAPDQLFGFGTWLQGDLPEAGHQHHHHESEIASACFYVDGPVTWAGLAAWTEVVRREYGRDLLRCKGILEIADIGRPVVLHGVQTLFEMERLPAWPPGESDHRSRLVCIGRNLDLAWLERSLVVLGAPAGTQPPASLSDYLAQAAE